MNTKLHSGCELLTSYLLGELSELDTQRFLTHLPVCETCTADLAELWGTHTALASAAVDADEAIDENAKARFLNKAFTLRPPAGIEVQPNLKRTASRSVLRRWRRSSLTSIAAVAAAFVLGIWIGHTSGTASYATYSPVQLLQEMPMKATHAAPNARGMAMLVSKGNNHELLVSVHHLWPVVHGSYNVWLLTNGHRHLAGMFMVNAHGNGVFSAIVPKNLSFTAIGITCEPHANDMTPQGPKVLGAPMHDL